MGQIDVSDLMSDPDLVEPMNIIHRTGGANSNGITTLVETGVPTFGSIQAVSGKTLQRLPAALQIQNIRSFWVRGKILSDGNCVYPDILVFKGVRFEVQMVFDWTNWGSGWSEGVCVQQKPSL